MGADEAEGQEEGLVLLLDVAQGSDGHVRQRALGHVANNSLFLILPGVQTPHLASHLLAGAVRRRLWKQRDHPFTFPERV